MDRPSLLAIYRVFYSVATSAVMIGGMKHRGYQKPLKDNVRTIMQYLEIPEDLYIRGTG